MTNKTLFPLALCLLLGLLLLACGGGASDNAANSSNAAAGNGNKAATNTAANTSTTSTSGDKIGVPECDEYIAKVEACLAKVPAAGQPAVKTSLDAMRKSWRDAAATPQGKAGLAAGCKQALETAKSTYSSYGCSW
ncbi:MAG: hypothetical protein M3444_15555 [Acidobacteriota bacterium]|jgi:hypothetical protein|nr:hypothetical protein [Acidobacteriota bacterium]